MTRVSVSVGVHALPDIAEAIAHAAQNPTHDPVVHCEVGDDRRSQKTWWVCYGEFNHHGFNDPTKLCASGGKP